MPSLVECRDAAVHCLSETLPVPVKAFSGGLDGAALTEKNLPSSAVFVAVLESSNVAELRTLDLDMRAAFGALVVTRSRRNQEEREADGLALAERVVRTVHGQTFGLQGVSPARVQSLSPLDDEDLSSQGVWVWAVVWIQDVVLKERS